MKGVHTSASQAKGAKNSISLTAAAPAREDVELLIALFNQGRYAEGETRARAMTASFPRHGFGWKVLGTLLKLQGQSESALIAMREAASLSPRDAEAQSNLGVVYGDLQRWPEAEGAYRNAIRLDRTLPNPYFNLALALQMQDKLADAEKNFQHAAQLKPKWTECELHWANVLHLQNKLVAAAKCYREVLSREPNLAHAHNNYGNVLKDQADYAAATVSFGRAIALQPQYAEAHNNLGIVLRMQGQLSEAEASYRRAIAISPDFAEAHYNLAISLNELRRYAEAEQSYRDALRARPEYPAALNNLGNLLESQRRCVESEALLRQAIALQPDYAEAHSNLGNSFRSQKRLADAHAAYSNALQLNPNLFEAWYNLGIVLAETNQLVDAEAAYRRALSIHEDYPEAHKNLGNTLKEQGYFAAAEASYRRALALRPDYIDAQSNLVFDMNYTATHTVGDCLDEARHFGRMVQETLARENRQQYTRWACDNAPSRVRVGFVSGDLHGHPVGFFLEALLNELKSENVDLFAYSAHTEEDDLTRRIRPHFSQWRSIVALNDGDAAALIHADGIHVLMDLSGHTARNRLPLFALRPAPVQSSWLGYFATTGVAEINYILGDPHVLPASEAGHFTETVWPLPETYLCFTPPDVQIDVAVLPAISNQYITFGSFNNLAKMTDAVVALWARVLLAVPCSRLLLKTKQLAETAARDRTIKRFESCGVNADRLCLEGPATRAELLASYNRVDVALDPFPYPGGTTSAEGLWMGVPVLTRKGDRFLSHVGETIANNAGLARWIASSDDDYVAKAVAYTANLDELAALRRGLRAQVVASPLFDASRFAKNFATTMWAMWDKYKLGMKS
jgi:protein O-GlcNAc transferase